MIELQKSNAQITFTTPTVSGGGYVDLSDYYTKEEVNNLIENVKVDLTGYATEDYVKQEIAAIPEVDLSNYYSKTEIDNQVSTLESDITTINNAGYQTAEQVNAAINEALGVIENGSY